MKAYFITIFIISSTLGPHTGSRYFNYISFYIKNQIKLKNNKAFLSLILCYNTVIVFFIKCLYHKLLYIVSVKKQLGGLSPKRKVEIFLYLFCIIYYWVYLILLFFFLEMGNIHIFLLYFRKH